MTEDGFSGDELSKVGKERGRGDKSSVDGEELSKLDEKIWSGVKY